MKIYSKNTIYLLIPILVLGLIYFFSGSIKENLLYSSLKTYTVVLTENGFEPQILEINRGDTVIFKTNVTRSFWPASDPHPTHTVYSEFDPKRPVISTEEWSFTFKSSGTWAFHDHLSISLNGKIIVKENKKSSLKSSNEICDDSNTQGEYCFDEQIRSIVIEKGINTAFELLAQKYDTGSIPAACHWSAHKIGEEAYLEQQRGKPLIMTKDTYYCGYGFYHGYLEVMLRANPDPEKQKDFVVSFCDSAQKEIGGEARDNCYHGIGSGYTENPPNMNVWGKDEKLVEPGLKICEQLFANTREWEMCTTGVYAVLAKFKAEEKYDFSFDKQDPFKFCADSPKKFHRPCYGEMSAKLEKITDGNLTLVSKYIKNVDINIAKLVVNVAVVTIMQRDILKDDQINFISDCKTFSLDLIPSCIDGIVWGFLYHGRINEEHVKAFKFCNSNLFDSKEQDFCYQRLVARAKNMYSGAKFDKICNLLKREYQHYCQEDLPVQLYE